MHSHTHALTVLAMGHGGLVWCSHYKAGCTFFSCKRTAVEQRQLIGRECSQLFHLRQTLITDARGQHLITSTPAFDVIVHPAYIYAHMHSQGTSLCPLWHHWVPVHVGFWKLYLGAKLWNMFLARNTDGNHYYHHRPDLWYCACERCRVKVQWPVYLYNNSKPQGT